MIYQKKIEHYQKKINQLRKKLPSNLRERIIPVRVTKVHLQNFTHYLEVTANVEPIQYAYVSPKASGEVKKILVHEGDYVKEGQLLIELDDQLILNNIAQLKVELALADSMYQKQARLYKKGVVSEVQYLQAKSQKESLEKRLAVLQTQLKYTKIYAPFSGIVDQINIKVGELAGPGARLIYLVNLDQMKAVANVSENYLPYIHLGDPIVLTFPLYPQIVLHTKITRIGDYIDPMTRTVKVETRFTNPQHKILPNMTARMKFASLRIQKVIILPIEILRKDVNGWYVFVISKNGQYTIANRRYVTLGQTTATSAVITSGLRPGELVVTDGYNLLRDGSYVRVVK
jgi:RND family efflux transporter MFP subunit